MKNLTRGLLILLSLCSTVALGVVAIGALWFVPQFVELFDGFGGELPFLTSAIVYSHYYWFLLPAVTLFVGIDTARRKELSPTHVMLSGGLFVGGFILAFLLFGVSIWAGYAPIFELSEKL